MGADQRLKVESSTLRAKADSITSDYPTMSTSAVPPCMLLISGLAMQKLEQNFQQLVGTVAAGKAEAARLAACLNAAADAYDKADAEAKASVDSGGPSGGAPVPVNPNLPPAAPPAPIGQCTAAPEDEGVDWTTAVEQFDAGDQGSSLLDFTNALRSFGDQLIAHGKKFSMGDAHWEGGAAEAAEAALRRHESWLYDLAVQTQELANQANHFADVHIAEHPKHPTAQDVAQVSELTGADWLSAYSAKQEQSDEVRRSYASQVDFADMMFKEPPSGAYPSAPVSPGDVAKKLDDEIHKMKEPPGGQSGSPTESGGGGGQPSGGGSPQAASPSTNPAAAQEQPEGSGGEQPSGGSGGGSPSGGEGGGSPSGGEGAGSGGGLPGGLPGGLGDGTGLGSGLPDDGGLKPASTGGGAGGGGAGGGLGGQPLQPAASAPAMGTSAASTGAGPSGVGAGGAGGGAMGGGMGGGMGGMGHGNRESGKEKKRNPNLSPEESLYVEDRPYTDPVIGHTRRTKIDDKKETK